MNTTNLAGSNVQREGATNSPAENLGLPLWAWWTAAHIGSAMFAVTINHYLFNGRQLAFIGFVALFVVALAQERLVRRYLPDFEAGRWLLTTSTGAILGLILAALVTAPLSIRTAEVQVGSWGSSARIISPSLVQAAIVPTLGSALFGLTVGVIQALVLRSYAQIRVMAVGRVSLWAWLNAVACGAAGGIAFLIVESARRSSMEAAIPQSNESAVQATAFLAGIAIVGMVSGLAADRVLPKFFQARTEATALITDQPPSQPLVVTLWLVTTLYGSLWLWLSYSLVQQTFQWPAYYTGPNAPGYSWDNTPASFYLQAKLLTASMLVGTIAFMLFAAALSVRAVRGSANIERKWWSGYWSMLLSSFVLLTLYNVVVFLIWIENYTD